MLQVYCQRLRRAFSEMEGQNRNAAVHPRSCVLRLERRPPLHIQYALVTPFIAPSSSRQSMYSSSASRKCHLDLLLLELVLVICIDQVVMHHGR